jgi:hypothetical protein
MSETVYGSQGDAWQIPQRQALIRNYQLPSMSRRFPSALRCYRFEDSRTARGQFSGGETNFSRLYEFEAKSVLWNSLIVGRYAIP